MTISLDTMRSELNAAVMGASPGTDTADALCTTCVSLFEIDGAAVSVILGGASSGTFGSSSALSRQLDEYQFTFGEGPCLDAVASRASVLVPDLNSPHEWRWPVLRGALLEDGIRGVFAVPIMLASVCVGALDLFRTRPGPLQGDALAGALIAAELASAPLLDLIAQTRNADHGDLDVREAAEDRNEAMTETDRVEVYQATGMLISALDVDADEALVRLRAHAISTGQTASEVARAVIERRLVLDRDPRNDPDKPNDGGRSRR